MARAVYPIMKLARPAEWAFPLDLDDLFEDEGVKVDDHFTYTTRYQVPERAVERIKTRIRDELEPEEAERFIALMEDEDWDVSFLVDTY